MILKSFDAYGLNQVGSLESLEYCITISQKFYPFQ